MSQLGGSPSQAWLRCKFSDLEKSLELFKLDVGRFPTTAEGLDAMVNRPASANGWNGPYIQGA